MKTRIEKDSLGEMHIPSNKLWGAVTQRSLENFRIGNHPMPLSIIKAIAKIKKAAVIVNVKAGKSKPEKAEYIQKAASMIINGELDQHFPLSVWQTGSGTHSNMNVNEVIANQAHLLKGGKLEDSKKEFHPNDDINKSQSSNDVFPSAIHMAVASEVIENLIPSLKELQQAFTEKAITYKNILKTGRTHMMDAVPLRMGDEFSAYASMIERGTENLNNSLPHLLELPIGGTAVGTGLNAPENFGLNICEILSNETKIEFKPARNCFESMSSKNALLDIQHTLSQIATDFFKIVNDIRLMASGPRAGLSELELPANEPGSSIMPGKINPTQIEAVQMACTRIISNTTGTSIANMNGNFQLNTFMPLIAYNTLESVNLLSDISRSFTKNSLKGLKVNTANISRMLNQSLMLVTALNAELGYEKAAKIAQMAHKEGLSLRDAAIKSGFIDAENFDRVVNPEKMV